MSMSAPEQTKPNSLRDDLVDLLFAAAAGSLFFGLRWQTPLGFLRPFEPLTLVCAGVMLWLYGRQMVVLASALSVHLCYFAWYTLSAFTVDAQNGLREGLQSASVVFFVLLLTALYVKRPRANVMRNTAIIVTLVAVVVAAWHVANGVPAGYKQLGDARAAFAFLPAIAASLIGRGAISWQRALIIFALLVLTVLSGERKAYMCLVLLGLTTTGLSAGRFAVVTLASAVAVLAALAVDPSNYVSDQFRSIASIGEHENFNNYTEEIYPTSISNAQRKFAIDAGLAYWQRSPLFGIGTNAYKPRVVYDYASAPSYLKLGIHGEFLRVLVENGAIGALFFYLGWIQAGLSLWRVLPREGFATGFRGVYLIRILLFGACLFYCAFEAAESLSMLAFLIPPLLPLLLPRQEAEAAPVARRVAPARTGSRWAGRI
jgi:hypothetical protein